MQLPEPLAAWAAALPPVDGLPLLLAAAASALLLVLAIVNLMGQRVPSITVEPISSERAPPSRLAAHCGGSQPTAGRRLRRALPPPACRRHSVATAASGRVLAVGDWPPREPTAPGLPPTCRRIPPLFAFLQATRLPPAPRGAARARAARRPRLPSPATTRALRSCWAMCPLCRAPRWAPAGWAAGGRLGCCKGLQQPPRPGGAPAVVIPATSAPGRCSCPPLRQVRELVSRAKTASEQWRGSPYSQRRLLLKVILKFIVENQEEICRCLLRVTRV